MNFLWLTQNEYIFTETAVLLCLKLFNSFVYEESVQKMRS